MNFLEESFKLDIWYSAIIENDLQGLVGRYNHKTRSDITRIEIYKINTGAEKYFSAFFYIKGTTVEKCSEEKYEKLLPVLEIWARKYYLNIFFGG